MSCLSSIINGFWVRPASAWLFLPFFKKGWGVCEDVWGVVSLFVLFLSLSLTHTKTHQKEEEEEDGEEKKEENIGLQTNVSLPSPHPFLFGSAISTHACVA